MVIIFINITILISFMRFTLPRPAVIPYLNMVLYATYYDINDMMTQILKAHYEEGCKVCPEEGRCNWMLEICPRGNNKLVIIIFPCS